MKWVEVRDTFRLADWDCLIVVGPFEGPIRKADVFDNQRGIRVQVTGIVTFDPPRLDQVAICVRPKDADITAGDVLKLVPDGQEEWIGIMPGPGG